MSRSCAPSSTSSTLKNRNRRRQVRRRLRPSVTRTPCTSSTSSSTPGRHRRPRAEHLHLRTIGEQPRRLSLLLCLFSSAARCPGRFRSSPPWTSQLGTSLNSTHVLLLLLVSGASHTQHAQLPSPARAHAPEDHQELPAVRHRRMLC